MTPWTFYLSAWLILAGTVGPDVESRLRAQFEGEENLQIRRVAEGQLLELQTGVAVYYATPDGRYLIAGPLIVAETGENRTAAAQAKVRRLLLEGHDSDFYLNFAGGNSRYTVTSTPRRRDAPTPLPSTCVRRAVSNAIRR